MQYSELRRWYETHYFFSTKRQPQDTITDLKDNLVTQSWQNQVNNISGSRQMYAKLQFHSLPFMGKDIVPTDTAKDLGVILDSMNT